VVARAGAELCGTAGMHAFGAAALGARSARKSCAAQAQCG
jgi:hypothetical protein